LERATQLQVGGSRCAKWLQTSVGWPHWAENQWRWPVDEGDKLVCKGPLQFKHTEFDCKEHQLNANMNGDVLNAYGLPLMEKQARCMSSETKNSMVTLETALGVEQICRTTMQAPREVSRMCRRCWIVLQGRNDGTATYIGPGGPRWRIEGSNGFNRSMDVSSASNSAEIARIDHGNGVGVYLGAEAARQCILEAEHLGNHADELNGTGDHADTFRVHTDVYSTENNVIMPTDTPENVRTP